MMKRVKNQSGLFGVFRALPFPLHLRDSSNGPNFNSFGPKYNSPEGNLQGRAIRTNLRDCVFHERNHDGLNIRNCDITHPGIRNLSVLFDCAERNLAAGCHTMLNPLLRGKSVDSGDNRADHHYSIHQGIVVLFIINAHQEGDQGSSGGEGFHDKERIQVGR